MRTAHSIFLALLAVLLLAACAGPSTQAASITSQVIVDGDSIPVTLPAGSTVQQALEAAKITLAQTDRVSPAAFMALNTATDIIVTRVREEFETQQVIVPFERQELRNESLTAGETRLVQAGQNGLNEITIRHIFEDGVETSQSVVSQTTLQEAVPEIVMIGVQSPFAPVSIPGKLAYLTGGNAWVMEGSTSIRKPLVTSGDLDGHIFSLSPDGKWLLFSRASTQPADRQINTLWVVSTTGQLPPVNLGVANVVHFAEWQPGQFYQIAYSTVEPRAAAPGWQANNDVRLLEFRNGKPGRTFEILGPNSGGIYGWWGTMFAWSPDGKSLAYARPDEVGLVDVAGKLGQTPLLSITPFNTHGDWAWTPLLAWSSDALVLYTVTHAASSGLVTPEESPNFDLTSIRLSSRSATVQAGQTGMFAYPAASSIRADESGSNTFQVAYLQAIFPAQSATSRYRLMVMNADGSEPRLLLPAEGLPGLEPQKPAWAPKLMDNSADLLGVIYEGNLWVVDAASGLPQQVTGDGLTQRIDWK